MKRVTMVVLILFCAASLFALAEDPKFGEITELFGTVELKPSGQTAFIPARIGDKVAMNTVVSTGIKSTVLIKVGSTVLSVRPLTRLSLAEISVSTGTETINVNIQTGRIRVDVKPPAGTRTSMTIQSPIATASVRGTSFEFDTHSLTVLEGTVAFQGRNGGEMMISAGSTSEINAFGRSEDPIDTFSASLQPPPPVGSNSGYKDSETPAAGTLDSDGEFDFGFIMH